MSDKENGFNDIVNNGSQSRREKYNTGTTPQVSYFDDETVANSEDIKLIESEDINYVAEEKARKQRKFKLAVLITILGLLFLAAGGYFGLQQALEQPSEPESEEAGAQAPDVEELPDGEEPIEIEEGVNPFDSIFDGEANPYEDEELVEVGNDRFVFSGSQVMLEAENADLTETSGAECELINNNDICYAGYIEYEDSDSGALSVYATKNIVENRLLENVGDANSQNVDGAEAAFLGTISVPAEDGEFSNPVLAIAAENGSGFILMFEGDASTSDFSGIAGTITIHN